MRNARLKLGLMIFSSVVVLTTPSQADTGGFIYGKITTREDKTYTGVMRWGSQECFWDDLFNAEKNENPWEEYAEGEVRREHKILIFGITTIQTFSSGLTHLFISRFGDLKSIEVKRRNRTVVTLKNGTEYEISGYGDVGETIQIWDAGIGKLKLDWDNIRTIEFLSTPASAKTAGYRLPGKVKTDEMEFNGYVMWDAEECLSSDLLEGESDDGDLAIEFGNIRSLKPIGSRACQVTLKDGRALELRGTNDVNEDNRGIYVQDDRFGKIEICWDQLVAITYAEEGSSGKPYDDYKPTRTLEGVVSVEGEQDQRGRLVFDFDEAETGDILNGNLDDMQFYVPFENLVSITPRGRYSSLVNFTSGAELRLEEGQDVTSNNTGLLIFRDAKKPDYIAWEDVQKITFTK